MTVDVMIDTRSSRCRRGWLVERRRQGCSEPIPVDVGLTIPVLPIDQLFRPGEQLILIKMSRGVRRREEAEAQEQA